MKRWGYLWVAALAMVTYRSILTFWFTGLDTFSLIYTARSTSLWEVFSTPMMGNTNFMMYGAYWRPVISLMFWLSSRVFGLEPAGYFALNLIWHGLAAVLVVALGARLVGWWWGLLAGHLFIFHPLLAENIPVISRGQDIIAAVFVLATLILILDGRYRWAWLTYGLALLSKEPGVLALPMAGVLLHRRRQLSLLLPMVAITAIYVGTRWWILGGLGGYSEPAERVQTLLFGLLYYPLLWVPWGVGQHIGGPEAVIIAGVSIALGAAVWRARSRDVAVLVLLLALPLAMFTVTAMQFWYFYLSAGLFAVMLSTIIKNGDTSARFVAGIIAVGVVATVPGLDAWQQAGKFNRWLTGAVETVEARPIYLYGVPYAVDQPRGAVRGVSFIEDHGLQSYLALAGQDNNINVVTVVRLAKIPDKVKIRQHDTALVLDHRQVENTLYSYWARKELFNGRCHPTEGRGCAQGFVVGSKGGQ